MLPSPQFPRLHFAADGASLLQPKVIQRFQESGPVVALPFYPNGTWDADLLYILETVTNRGFPLQPDCQIRWWIWQSTPSGAGVIKTQFVPVLSINNGAIHLWQTDTGQIVATWDREEDQAPGSNA